MVKGTISMQGHGITQVQPAIILIHRGKIVHHVTHLKPAKVSEPCRDMTQQCQALWSLPCAYEMWGDVKDVVV